MTPPSAIQAPPGQFHGLRAHVLCLADRESLSIQWINNEIWTFGCGSKIPGTQNSLFAIDKGKMKTQNHHGFLGVFFLTHGHWPKIIRRCFFMTQGLLEFSQPRGLSLLIWQSPRAHPQMQWGVATGEHQCTFCFVCWIHRLVFEPLGYFLFGSWVLELLASSLLDGFLFMPFYACLALCSNAIICGGKKSICTVTSS